MQRLVVTRRAAELLEGRVVCEGGRRGVLDVSLVSLRCTGKRVYSR
jgi:hypothetical protein